MTTTTEALRTRVQSALEDLVARQASAQIAAWAMQLPGCDGSADWVEIGPNKPEPLGDFVPRALVWADEAQHPSAPSTTPVLWITRHRDDTPGALPTVHYSAVEAAQHLAQFREGVARTVALVEAGVPSAEPAAWIESLKIDMQHSAWEGVLQLNDALRNIDDAAKAWGAAPLMANGLTEAHKRDLPGYSG